MPYLPACQLMTQVTPCLSSQGGSIAVTGRDFTKAGPAFGSVGRKSPECGKVIPAEIVVSVENTLSGPQQRIPALYTEAWGMCWVKFKHNRDIISSSAVESVLAP